MANGLTVQAKQTIDALVTGKARSVAQAGEIGGYSHRNATYRGLARDGAAKALVRAQRKQTDKATRLLRRADRMLDALDESADPTDPRDTMALIGQMIQAAAFIKQNLTELDDLRQQETHGRDYVKRCIARAYRYGYRAAQRTQHLVESQEHDAHNPPQVRKA